MPVTIGFETAIRGYTPIESVPSAKPVPAPPDAERPPAFIRWGRAANFKSGLRDLLNDPGGTRQDEPVIPPLEGDYFEEARTWEDIEVVNPENAQQKVQFPRTDLVAFTAPRRFESDPRSGYERNQVEMHDQVTFSFNSAFDDHGLQGGPDWPPYLLNREDGQAFQPYVLSPFQSIVDVGWPTNEFFLVYLMFENAAPDVGMALVNPSGCNINSWGGLGKDPLTGKNINVGDLVVDGNGHPILLLNPDTGVYEKQYWGAPNDLRLIPLTTIAEGVEGGSPTDTSGGSVESFPADVYPFRGVTDVGLFTFLPIAGESQNGSVNILQAPPSGDFSPNLVEWNAKLAAFMDHWLIPSLGADGPLVTFDKDGKPVAYGGDGVIKPGEQVPARMRLAVGLNVTVHGWTVRFQNLPGQPAAVNDEWPTKSTTSGIGGGLGFYQNNLYFYKLWKPAYQIRQPRTFKWWVGYINAYFIWKLFRDTYTGAAKLGNTPEPIEVNIYASVPKAKPGDATPGIVRARWSWHKGSRALSMVESWDKQIREPKHDGGGGPG